MSNEEFRQHSEGVMDKAIADLMVHFDDIQIFGTRMDDKQTMACSRGAGNWYARVGHVSEWLNVQHQRPTPEDSE